jgi:hypothetical protein
MIRLWRSLDVIGLIVADLARSTRLEQNRRGARREAG